MVNKVFIIITANVGTTHSNNRLTSKAIIIEYKFYYLHKTTLHAKLDKDTLTVYLITKMRSALNPFPRCVNCDNDKKNLTRVPSKVVLIPTMCMLSKYQC